MSTLSLHEASIARVSRLIVWTHVPTIEPLTAALAPMTDNDLLFCLGNSHAPAAARLAWAEYGRRRGFIDFKLSVVHSEGDVTDVVFEGKARAAHEAPLYGITPPKDLLPSL